MVINKTILVTGCSSGIGLYCAQELKQHGYRIFASARKTEAVEQLQAQGFETVQLDLADSRSIRLAVEQVLEKTGGQLYALFNNAAYGQPGAVEDLLRILLMVNTNSDPS